MINRRTTEAQLKESEERYLSLVEQSPDIIVIHCEGKIEYINREGISLFGASNEREILGHSTLEFIHPDDRQRVRQRIEKSLSTGTVAPKTEERFLLPDNRIVYAEVTGLPITYQGRPAMQVIIRDITEQKRVSAAIQLQEKQQALILHSLPVILYRVGLTEQLPTTWISDQVMDITGFSPRAFTDDPLFWESRLHPEEREEIIKKYKTLLTNHSVTIEYRFCCANGFYRWFTDHLIVILDDGGTPVDTAGIWIDISKNKQTEFALKEQERKYRLLAEYSADVIWIMNTDKKFTYVSPSVEKLRGYTPEEVMQQPWEAVLTPESRLVAEAEMELVLSKIGQLTHKLNPKPVELEQPCKDGSTVWTEAVVQPMFGDKDQILGFVGVTRNISERKLAQEALLQAERRSSGLIEHASDGIVMISLDGRFSYISPPAFKIFGYSPGDIDLKNPEELTHPEDRPMVIETLNSLIQDPLLVPTIRYRFLHKDGNWRWIESTFSNLLNVAGIEALVINFHDITYSKEAEEELLRAKMKAEESDRLKSAFLANMSHEIRTPMNTIIGFASLLADGELSDEERNRFSEIIQSRSEDLLHLINDILDISRIESGNVTVLKERVSLNAIIDEMESVFGEKLRRTKKTHLILSTEKGLSTHLSDMKTDGFILKQVFSNLIDNAIKYTETGSIRFGYHPPNENRITFFVKDTGIGISPEYREVIFQHFRQADSTNTYKYGGAGLGLSICKGSITLLGGDIRVESEPGKGSTFLFTLPYESLPESQKNAFSVPAGEKVKCSYRWNGKKILLVEDEETNMEFLKIILKPTQAELIPAYSGKEVVKLYGTLASLDLVLLDIRLPDASGLDLAGEIKKTHPDLPVIAQTAYAMSSDKHKIKAAGCDNYISKPINKNKLLEMISGYFE